MSLQETLHLQVLPKHAHVLLLSCLAWQCIFMISPRLSTALFPSSYRSLSTWQKTNWDLHVVSLTHSIVIIATALPILTDPYLINNKVFGYTNWSGNVYAVACGYFLWDFLVSLRYIKEQGFSFAAHGICSFSVYLFSFRPFLHYYGAVFLLYELSTPFLNINWFMDKIGLTGSILQLINGLCLLASFLGARLFYGFYMSYQTYLDVLQVASKVPAPILVLYGAANIVLNSLNVIWFQQMINMIRKRFRKVNGESGGKPSRRTLEQTVGVLGHETAKVKAS